MAAREACMAHPDHFNYTVDITHEHSMAWLRQMVQEQQASASPNAAKPFFLYEAFTVPHAGGWGHAPSKPEDGAPVPTDLQYAEKNWPDVEKDHAAVITYLDGLVGELVAELKHLGVEKNTLVIFASDNGAHLEGGHDYHFFNSTGGLLGHKRSLYEGGVRSPTMMSWPGTIPAGSVSPFSWAFWDVMPTFAELSGGIPSQGIDGISFLPTILGKEQSPLPYLFWNWINTGVPPLESHGLNPKPNKSSSGYAIRSGVWKAVVPHCSTEQVPSLNDMKSMEIYHLSNDPFEKDNLA